MKYRPLERWGVPKMQEEIKCNCCGQPIKKPDGRNCEDYLQVEKTWGYFSSKDLTSDSFIICETCYNKWIKTFAIPIKEAPVLEIFTTEDE